jgi:predicted metal-binding membrane protein
VALRRRQAYPGPGLMLVLFALGAMSVTWMFVVAALVFA